LLLKTVQRPSFVEEWHHGAGDGIRQLFMNACASGNAGRSRLLTSSAAAARRSLCVMALIDFQPQMLFGGRKFDRSIIANAIA
jgi:hypothetical protein